MAVRSQNQSKEFFSTRFEVHIPKLCFGDVAHDFKKKGLGRVLPGIIVVGQQG